MLSHSNSHGKLHKDQLGKQNCAHSDLKIWTMHAWKPSNHLQMAT